MTSLRKNLPPLSIKPLQRQKKYKYIYKYFILPIDNINNLTLPLYQDLNHTMFFVDE